MAQQTFALDKEPRIVITRLRGDLTVRAWQQSLIQIESDGSVSDLRQEGNAVMISDCDSDLLLQVPTDTSISATHAAADVEIDGVRRVALENIAGDVTLRNISGDAVLEDVAPAIELTKLGRDLVVTSAPDLRVRHTVGHDATLKDVAVVEIETIGGDLAVASGETVTVATVGGDLQASYIVAALRCGLVGGDCAVRGSARTQVVIGNVGGDCAIGGAAKVHAGNIAGDCALRDVQGAVELGHISGSGDVQGVGGNLQAGTIGGDGALKGIQGSVEVGGIGGDLQLQALFPVDTRSRLIVGGDAKIVLPENADLNMRATVGGDISGQSISASRSGHLLSLVYGEGRAHLDLNIGGDLDLKGSSSPRSSSSSADAWNDFGHEMSQLGRDLGKLGQELGQEIASAFKESSWHHGAGLADDITRKAEERAERINFRFNDREWRLDPQRLERIREQARRAANEGVAGALDAVERAMSNLRIHTPPPFPPSTPAAPSASPEPAAARSETAPDSALQERTHAADKRGLDLEQEREAILRMIAEGRVTPEEGDLLLEALGS